MVVYEGDIPIERLIDDNAGLIDLVDEIEDRYRELGGVQPRAQLPIDVTVVDGNRFSLHHGYDQ